MYTTNIPTKNIGPIEIVGNPYNEIFHVPMATYETTLWHSINRGAKATSMAGGINSIVIKDFMTRSIILEAKNNMLAHQISEKINQNFNKISEIVKQTSNYANLKDIYCQIIGNLIYIRLSIDTKEAAGHNMTTKAADEIINYILKLYKDLKYISISGNICVDKKISSINGILGRGKYVVAEVIISKDICKNILKTSPKDLVNLHVKKNLIGSIISGGIRTANAHFANMLLAFYLATGQDAANIVEGSQGVVHCQEKDEDLYFSVTLPNIIIGSVGNGKNIECIKNNLKTLNIINVTQQQGMAKKMAIILGGVVLCGELSLLAAQTNKGELTRSHMIFERKNI